MTTIAATLTAIASDSRCTWEVFGAGQANVQKLFPIGDSVFGVAGNPDYACRALQWIREGCKADTRPDLPDDDENDFVLLQLSPQGLFVWSGVLTPVKLFEHCVAVGTGAKVAQYAMAELHMSPKEAVEAACKVDRMSGGPIQFMSLGDLQHASKTSKPRTPKASHRRRQRGGR